MRPQCRQCLRPQSACLCSWISPTANQVSVLILQHPLELGHAKGSARLLHMSLQHSRLLTGEHFDAAELSRELDGGGLCPLLLYPADVDSDPAPALQPSELSRVRLVVVDGTWRKSRKMLHLNPALQRLPRLALKTPPPSSYRIRKAHRPEQLATLEATCLALSQLESASDRYAPLLRSFDAFVASQLR